MSTRGIGLYLTTMFLVAFVAWIIESVWGAPFNDTAILLIASVALLKACALEDRRTNDAQASGHNEGEGK